MVLVTRMWCGNALIYRDGISAVNCQLPTAVSRCRAAPNSLDCLGLQIIRIMERKNRPNWMHWCNVINVQYVLCITAAIPHSRCVHPLSQYRPGPSAKTLSASSSSLLQRLNPPPPYPHCSSAPTLHYIIAHTIHYIPYITIHYTTLHYITSCSTPPVGVLVSLSQSELSALESPRLAQGDSSSVEC